MPTNLATVITDAAERQSDRVAIKLDDFEICFALKDTRTISAST